MKLMKFVAELILFKIIFFGWGGEDLLECLVVEKRVIRVSLLLLSTSVSLRTIFTP
jgi:hypothetical protein